MDIDNLLKQVFQKKDSEKVLFLYDIPKKSDPDWDYRISLASRISKGHSLASYEATYSNNADLPQVCVYERKIVPLVSLLAKFDILIALSEFSPTAPLSKLAKKYGFRGATMPGFTKEMLPALEIDFNKLKKDVAAIDFGESSHIVFEVEGKRYDLHFDLRGMKVLRDDGDCSKKGRIINLPSGETFISPKDIDSGTQGFLPIQETPKSEVVVYKVENNRIVSADKETALMKRISNDPAVGNIAELAIGVLGRYGIEPCGRTLLDEKLGPHIALGRNDHFGGTIGVSSFKKPENVWHQDY
ncbi:MAG: hypothetical protein NDI94_03040, partial [Candidatus Woesearchaeota archaeon]|nr:hypothetical protein [Candidatus Woesearchaeota archaeon]